MGVDSRLLCCLNSLFSDYINDAMKYGAKPVMIVPIDQNFRKSAEKILRTESADDLRNLIRDEYSDGKDVKMESYIDGFTTESGNEILKTDDANSFTLEMDKCIDGLLDIYEDSLEFEAARVDTKDMSKEEKDTFDVAYESKKKIVKRARDKKNRKKVITEMLQAVDNMVNSKVKFTYGTEAMVMRDTSKICNQIKTSYIRRNK